MSTYSKSTVLLLVTLIQATAGATELDKPGTLVSVFDRAEDRFQPPSRDAFAQTQSALLEEVQRVDELLQAEGEDYARAWKKHLRWSLLESNLGAFSEVDFQELQLVRRWFYSNREGLELKLFEQLRLRLDDYVDVVYALQHPDLQAAFNHKVAQARQLCQRFELEPLDENTQALANCLGWFEQVSQLREETAAIRDHASFSNLEVVISPDFVSRVTEQLSQDVTESLPVTETVEIPSNRSRRTRTMKLTGTATSTGQVKIWLVDNSESIEFLLNLQGQVRATCRGITGPIELNLLTSGTVTAKKPVYLNTDGFDLGSTVVTANVSGNITEIDARSRLVRRIGTRRTSQPEMKALTDRRSRDQTRDRVQRAFDERVDKELRALQASAGKMLQSTGGLSELLAAVAREGAKPNVDSVSSPGGSVEIRLNSARRTQWPATQACPRNFSHDDIQIGVHVSFLNNTAETMLGGKRLSDRFFKKHAELFHHELPAQLQVNSTRWAVRASRQRPIEFQTLDNDDIMLTMRFDALEIGGHSFEGTSTATLVYRLEHDGESIPRLQRAEVFEFNTQLPTEQAVFLKNKIAALLPPGIGGPGKDFGDDRRLDVAQAIEEFNYAAEGGWLMVGCNVADAQLDELLRKRKTDRDQALAYQ